MDLYGLNKRYLLKDCVYRKMEKGYSEVMTSNCTPLTLPT